MSSFKQSDSEEKPRSFQNRVKSSFSPSDTADLSDAVRLPPNGSEVAREKLDALKMPLPVWAALRVTEAIERSRKMARAELIQWAGRC